MSGKDLTDNKLKMAELMESVLYRLENIVENRIFFFSNNDFKDFFWSGLFYSIPNNKIMDWSKLKAFADNNLNVNEKLKIVLGRVENIVGKRLNAFSPFPTMFAKGFFLRVVKSRDCVVKREPTFSHIVFYSIKDKSKVLSNI